MTPPLRNVKHRHEWTWVDPRLGHAEEGEFCRICGRVRDRAASLPPVRLGLLAFSDLYAVESPDPRP